MFCDVWGCVHDGLRPYKEAIAALSRFRQKDGTVVLLTNSPRPWRHVQRQIDKIGVVREAWDIIVTSGDAAKDALFQGRVGRRVFHIGPTEAMGFFEPDTGMQRDSFPIEVVPFRDAEGIVCTGLFDDIRETPESYRSLLTEAHASGMKLLCANPDLVVDRGPQRVYCAGAIARLFRQIGGESLLFGKPRGDIYRLARHRVSEMTGATSERILCVGDGVLTDVRGASRQSLQCLFVTGGLAAAETRTSSMAGPDPEMLASYLETEEVRPEYAIAYLR